MQLVGPSLGSSQCWLVQSKHVLYHKTEQICHKYDIIWTHPCSSVWITSIFNRSSCSIDYVYSRYCWFTSNMFSCILLSPERWGIIFIRSSFSIDCVYSRYYWFTSNMFSCILLSPERWGIIFIRSSFSIDCVYSWCCFTSNMFGCILLGPVYNIIVFLKMLGITRGIKSVIFVCDCIPSCL